MCFRELRITIERVSSRIRPKERTLFKRNCSPVSPQTFSALASNWSASVLRRPKVSVSASWSAAASMRVPITLGQPDKRRQPAVARTNRIPALLACNPGGGAGPHQGSCLPQVPPSMQQVECVGRVIDEEDFSLQRPQPKQGASARRRSSRTIHQIDVDLLAGSDVHLNDISIVSICHK